jgi:hypothetical protein
VGTPSKQFRPIRFWIEVGLASLAAITAGITVLIPQWIERVFHVDPDRGSGALEWLIVGALAVLAVVFAATAFLERRRKQAVA